jgi:putative colanic acid biosysnthesis UDP-glucose lipid carrier transferase
VKNRFNPIITATLLLLDVIIINSCFIYTYLMQYHFRPNAYTSEFWGFVFYINFIWVVIAVAFRLYNSYRMERIKRILIPAFLSIVIFFFFFLLYFQVFTFDYLNRDEVKYFFMVFAVLMILVKSAEHLLLPYLVKLINKPLKAIIVGYSKTARELADFFEKDLWSNYRFMGYFTDRRKHNEPILGDYTTLRDYLENEQTDDVFLLLNLIPKNLQKEIVQLTKNQYTNIHLVPELSLFSMMNVTLHEFGNVPALHIQRGPLSKWHNQLLKRTFDLLFSIIIIVGLLSWITPLLWLLNAMLYSQGPFFFQSRNGLNNL